MDSSTPSYYKVTDQLDLTDIMVGRYPLYMEYHLIFECIQYLWRCTEYGRDMKSDIVKVHNITGRLMNMLDDNAIRLSQLSNKINQRSNNETSNNDSATSV